MDRLSKEEIERLPQIGGSAGELDKEIVYRSSNYKWINDGAGVRLDGAYCFNHDTQEFDFFDIVIVNTPIITIKNNYEHR